MMKQIRKLTGFFGISISLISLSYLKIPTLAINLGIVSEVDTENNNFIDSLPKFVITNSNMEFVPINVDLQSTIIEENNSILDVNFPEILARETTNYLALIAQQNSETNTNFKGINLTNLTSNKQQFSGQNFFNYFNGDQPVQNSIMAETKGDRIFQNLYDFAVVTQTVSDLNLLLSNPQSPNNNNQDSLANNSRQNNNNNTNDNLYADLQQQLVASATVPRVADQYTNTNRNTGIIATPVDTGFVGIANPVRPRNTWGQYFSKGQQYSKLDGLIEVSPYSSVSKQLQLQQQVEKEIQEKMPFTKTATQKSLQFPKR